MGSPPRPFLAVVAWNANGLTPKIDELRDFVEDHNLDVVMINETHLRQGVTMKIRNFDGYFTYRPVGRFGGTAILVKNSIPHTQVHLPELQSVEATAVNIRTAQGPIRFVSTYCTPLRRLLEKDLRTLLDSGTPTILAGDLNAKHHAWNSRRDNNRGKQLKKIADLRKWVVAAPDTPTHFSFHGGAPDVLDIAIFSRLSVPFDITSVAELNSDHNPVIINLDISSMHHREQKIVDWSRYTELVADNIGGYPAAGTPVTIEDGAAHLTEVITTSLAQASKTRSQAPNHLSLPPHIRRLIKEKNRARREWQHSREQQAKTEMNRRAQLCRQALRLHGTRNWSEYSGSLNTRDDSLWRHIKTIRNPNERKSLPPIRGPSGLATEDDEKAEVLAELLEKQFTPNDDPSDPGFAAGVERLIARYLAAPSMNATAHTDVEEVSAVIKALEIKKSPGLDRVPNKAIKLLPKEGIGYLVQLINGILELSYFPTIWKTALVIPIQKPGTSPTLPESYRPISLLPGLAKVAERVFLKRINKFLNENAVLSDCQFGFREGHSTTLQLVRLVEDIAEAHNHSQSTGVVFLDIAKAFDKVWHSGLVFKLALTGLPSAIVKLVDSYLQGRSFAVRVGGSVSHSRPIRSGVPQGSILGPTLFDVYINDVPAATGTSIALYADDTAIFSSDKDHGKISVSLQRSLRKMEKWFTKWRIKVNPAKSKAVVFTRRAIPPGPELQLSGRQFPGATPLPTWA